MQLWLTGEKLFQWPFSSASWISLSCTVAWSQSHQITYSKAVFPTQLVSWLGLKQQGSLLDGFKKIMLLKRVWQKIIERQYIVTSTIDCSRMKLYVLIIFIWEGLLAVEWKRNFKILAYLTHPVRFTWKGQFVYKGASYNIFGLLRID